ncbi:23913_t:CDS:2, partial [Entrophospora sp. SA101]
FFVTLLIELSQLNDLIKQIKGNFELKINQLSKILTDATSPYKKDLYNWRQIFRLYLQAEIFIGNTESDRSEK